MSEARGRRLLKVRQLVDSGCVKRHVFAPSEREVWTVVGRQGDLLVSDQLPYCSCMHFHFGVMAGLDETCVHLEALRLARQESSYRELRLGDDEFGQLLRFLIRDFSSSL